RIKEIRIKLIEEEEEGLRWWVAAVVGGCGGGSCSCASVVADGECGGCGYVVQELKIEDVATLCGWMTSGLPIVLLRDSRTSKSYPGTFNTSKFILGNVRSDTEISERLSAQIVSSW
ncbi:hypothetical protein Tco_1076320, partial [Tanacetum coccineum]